MWKVRALNADGDLTEHHVDADLKDIAAMDFGGPIMVVQREKPPAGPADAAKGESSVSVEKG